MSYPSDTEMLEFLAYTGQWIANVQLPTECVERHPESLRDAIADAMEMHRAAIRAQSQHPADTAESCTGMTCGYAESEGPEA